MEGLGVGVIGLGVGAHLAAAFDHHPECRLAALCDQNEARLMEVGSQFPGAKRYRSAEEMIDDPGLQIVVVASYDHQHAFQILRALRAKRHIFSEKPICTTEAEAAAIREALAESPGLRLTTNTLLRASPRFLALHKEILRGNMGKLYYCEADYNYGRFEKLTRGWRGQSPRYSVMLGGGIHMIDLLLWLIGSPVIEVAAYGNAIAARSAGSAFSGNDLAVALLRFADGTVAKVAANFGCVFPHFHRLVLYGTKATFENALPDALRYTSCDPAVSPEHVVDAYPGMQKGALIPSFVDAIAGRGRAMVDEQDAFAALSVSFAIDRSLASGRPEAVNPI